MKKITVLLSMLLMAAICITATATVSFAEDEESENSATAGVSVPEDTLITYGYLEQYKEILKQEIIDELMDKGGITVETPYSDISANKGQVIILSPESEVIYRGGGAVAITTSLENGEGITDMSSGRELFSGEALEYGHIYFASESQSRKAIVVTGETAYFTVRGEYEIG